MIARGSDRVSSCEFMWDRSLWFFIQFLAKVVTVGFLQNCLNFSNFWSNYIYFFFFRKKYIQFLVKITVKLFQNCSNFEILLIGSIRPNYILLVSQKIHSISCKNHCETFPKLFKFRTFDNRFFSTKLYSVGVTKNTFNFFSKITVRLFQNCLNFELLIIGSFRPKYIFLVS